MANEMTFNKPPEWGKMFTFPENIQVEYNDYQGSVTREIAVKMVERYEDAVAKQIAMEAKLAGVADCTVLNKAAILDALNKQTPKQPVDLAKNELYGMCAVCGNVVHVGERFCDQCGQALDWEDDNDEHQLLKDTSAKQEWYISELEKQIGLLQKTLDLIDKNKPRFIVKSKAASSADIVDIFNREPVILHTENDSIIPVYPDRWIPVSERLPEVQQRILVYCESKTIRKHVTACTYMGGYLGHKQFSRHVRNVTHWMPLPEPPKGE